MIDREQLDNILRVALGLGKLADQGKVADAIQALPDPVHEAAKEVLALLDQRKTEVWDAFERLRAALDDALNGGER